MNRQKLVIFFLVLGSVMFVFSSMAYAQPLFEWSFNGSIEGMVCVRMNEPSEPGRHHWRDNYLCSEEDLGLRWSFSGPIDGLRCTRVREPSEPDRHDWDDNFLCLPWSSNIELSWSPHGPIEDKECVQIREPSDRDYWNDNYLCYVVFPYSVSQPPPETQDRLLGWNRAEYPTFNTLPPASTNPCINDVPRALYDLDSGPRDSAFFSFATAVDGTGDFGRHPHAQGIARLPGFERENWVVVSKSGVGESEISKDPTGANKAALVFVRFPGLSSDGGPWAEADPTGTGDFDKGKAEISLHPVIISGTTVTHSTHIGGLQTVGRMLVAGWDRGGKPITDDSTRFVVDFYDISNPWDIRSEGRLLNRFISGELRAAHYVAATKLNDGTYLLLVASDGRRQWTGPRRFRFFRSDSVEITSETTWTFINPLDIPKQDPNSLSPVIGVTWPFINLLDIPEGDTLGYQSANMITECMTGEIYLAGMRPWRIRRNFIDLWRLEKAPDGTIGAVQVDAKQVRNTSDGCSFDAGGGIHITPDRKMVVYCVEKVQDFGGVREAKLDVEEFRDR